KLARWRRSGRSASASGNLEKRLRLEYQISQADFMAAYEAHWRSLHLGTGRALIEGSLAILAGIAFVCFGHWFGYVIVALGLMFLAFILLRRFLHRRAFAENPKFAGPIVATFEEEGIRSSSALGESTLEWSIYNHVVFETDDYFLPMISKRSFSIIPKRAFGCDDEVAAFRQLLTEKLGEVRLI
ncbi:MAG: hypothetical protein ACI9MB_000118, partial [Verrucomicrobiales bacterium]